MIAKLLFFLVCLTFFMSLTDFLPKRNFVRRIFTVTKIHQTLASLLSVLLLSLLDLDLDYDNVTTFLLSGFTLANNMFRLIPYTPFYPKAIKDGIQADLDIYALNVRQKNNSHDRVIDSMRSVHSDIIVLTETDEIWADKLLAFDSDYPFQVKVPLNNTYGMMLLSKHRIVRFDIKFLVTDEVPSIHADILIDDFLVHLILIHPEPPLDIRRLKEKDLEVLLVSDQIEDKEVPVILCGDLNDVGWSFASRHMCEQTKMEDPRIGRGLFNTYNAHIPFFRYPIDHFFVSPSLKVVDLEVLDKCGSDHFPVRISLDFSRGNGVDTKKG